MSAFESIGTTKLPFPNGVCAYRIQAPSIADQHIYVHMGQGDLMCVNMITGATNYIHIENQRAFFLSSYWQIEDLILFKRPETENLDQTALSGRIIVGRRELQRNRYRLYDVELDRSVGTCQVRRLVCEFNEIECAELVRGEGAANHLVVKRRVDSSSKKMEYTLYRIDKRDEGEEKENQEADNNAKQVRYELDSRAKFRCSHELSALHVHGDWFVLWHPHYLAFLVRDLSRPSREEIRVSVPNSQFLGIVPSNKADANDRLLFVGHSKRGHSLTEFDPKSQEYREQLVVNGDCKRQCDYYGLSACGDLIGVRCSERGTSFYMRL